MIRIYFGSSVNIKSFLQVNNTDYIDVIYRNEICYFITNSNEAFALVRFKAACSAEQGEEKFRIHRNILLGVGADECMDVSVENGLVTASFYDENMLPRCHCTFKVQVVPETMYEEKMNLAADVCEAAVIDGDEYDPLFRIAVLGNGIVNVDDGVAAVFLQNNTRIYSKVTTNLSFSFTKEAFRALCRCSKHFCSVRNYLIAHNEDFFVVVKKARLNSNSEYRLISSNRFGSKYVAEINLSNIFCFLARTNAKIDSITLDFTQEAGLVSSFSAEFSIPVAIENYKLAEGASMEPVSLSASLFSGVLNNLGSNVFTVKVKKNYVQFETERFIVVV